MSVTREEILKLDPGVHADALVAEHVLGCRVFRPENGEAMAITRGAMPCYVAPPQGDAGVMYCKPGYAHPFAPSKYLADCWLALGALRKKGWDVTLAWGRDGRGSCVLAEPGKPIMLVTDASPHMAAVRACLLAALGLSREE